MTPKQRLTQLIATHEWEFIRDDGSVARWHQEDETAVKSTEEAVAMIQRTVDFWFPVMRSRFQEEGDSEPVAHEKTRKAFYDSLRSKLSEGIAARWNVALDDVKLLSLH